MGITITLTGLGPIVMPLLIDALLEHYATTGTLLILAGIATHSLIGATLLRPFREHKEVSYRYVKKKRKNVKVLQFSSFFVLCI